MKTSPNLVLRYTREIRLFSFIPAKKFYNAQYLKV
jgi:hypothetical protein